MKRALITHGVAVATMVVGAIVGKWISVEAGLAIVAAGGWWSGKNQDRPKGLAPKK